MNGAAAHEAAAPFSAFAALKRAGVRADSQAVHAATDVVELQGLRARIDALAHRRVAAEERLAFLPDSPTRRQLEVMRFELAELEWQLADLEAESAARR